MGAAVRRAKAERQPIAVAARKDVTHDHDHDHDRADLLLMTALLMRKLAFIHEVTDGMAEGIRILCQDNVEFSRGDTVVEADADYAKVFLIREGWAVRYKLLASGDRQIINFALPGDFLGFNASIFRRSDHYIAAKTHLRAFALDIPPFRKMLSSHPSLALAMAWANAHEEAMLAERITSLGRRSARQRMAHLFCELWRRLELLDLATQDSFPLPVTQEDLGDTLGLTVVHVNRTLRRLCLDGLVAREHGRIRVVDKAGLEQVAGFEDGYLHFTEEAGRRR